MKRILTVVTVFVLSGWFFPGTAAAEQKYTLRYQFRPGETLRWNVTHRAATRTTVSDHTERVETETRSVKAWRVRSLRPDGAAVFEHMVESVDMRQRPAVGKEIRYDSRTDAKPPMGFEDAAAAVGVPLSIVTLDPRGKVLHRERKVTSAATPGNGEMTIPLPEKPVAVGQSWSLPCDIQVTLKTGGVKTIKAVQQFTLEGVKTGVATIRVATQIYTPLSDPQIEVQVVERETAGVVRFDIDAGRILSQQMDVDKHVVGFQGGASSIHYQMRFSEELLPEPARTARKNKDEG
ncbi:MAG: hypothetical protein JXB10_12640 [Pirellulales bacterium]|nr:hypothetical protein [Pirellulales bacterium]